MSVRQWDLDPLPRAEAGRPAPVIRVSLGAEGNSATETGEAAEPAAGRAQQGRELGPSRLPLSARPELESEAGGSCRGSAVESGCAAESRGQEAARPSHEGRPLS